MDWKKSFYHFVRAYNQWEMNYRLDEADIWIADSAYLAIEKNRLERIKYRNLELGILPQRHETKLRIEDAKKVGDTLDISFTLKRKIMYLAQGQEHVEERLERRRTEWTRTAGGRWYCQRMQWKEADPEAKYSAKVDAFDAMSGYDAASGGPKLQTSSIPYLNYDLLNPRTARFQYDRWQAKQYADMWWDHANPEYTNFDVNCTNYVSQCLFAGGAPMNYTGRRDAGWWYQKGQPKDRWSFSWSVAHSLCWYLADRGLHAEEVDSPEQLQVGDVILYDFEGDSSYNHSTIVTAHNASGMPLVNAHTVSSKNRYWDYQDSYAWTKQTTYRFFHIPDRA